MTAPKPSRTRFFSAWRPRSSPGRVFSLDDGAGAFPDTHLAWMTARIASRASILLGWRPGKLPGPSSFLDNRSGSEKRRRARKNGAIRLQNGSGRVRIASGSRKRADLSRNERIQASDPRIVEQQGPERGLRMPELPEPDKGLLGPRAVAQRPPDVS